MEKATTFVGLDVHKEAINVAMLLPGETRASFALNARQLQALVWCRDRPAPARETKTENEEAP